MAKKKDIFSNAVSKAKSWYKSKTFIGIIILIVNPALKLFGIDFDLGDVAETTLDEAANVATYLDSIWARMVEAFGAILASYGRIKAKVPILGFGLGGDEPPTDDPDAPA